MNKQVICCDQMERILSEGKIALRYIPKFREFGINILDGGTSFQEIKFCPWCGKMLPKSLREDWFNELENLGLEPDSKIIPEFYISDKWWKQRNL